MVDPWESFSLSYTPHKRAINSPNLPAIITGASRPLSGLRIRGQLDVAFQMGHIAGRPLFNLKENLAVDSQYFVPAL
jgi:hypothetical protein